MKTIKLILLTTLVLLSACKNFDDLQFDPNRATQAHPGLLLTNIEASTFGVIDLGAGLASRMLVFTDGATNEQYYGWQRAGFDRYNNLRQIGKMVEEADRLELGNYKALALFLDSYQILEITKVFGDVPYTQADQGSEGIYKPAYDSQESIYLKVLDDLKSANNMLDASQGAITGDIIYGGDIDKWKKLINSYSLRVLISLSGKTGNSSLNVEARFKDIVDHPDVYPIFESNADNAALNYYDLTGNRYPYFNNNNLKTAYYMEESFVDLLKNFQDPRLFIFADRKPQGSALPDNDFNAYGGLGGSDPLADNTNRLLNGEGSPVDARYHDDPVNEPSLLLSYAEVEFTLAEAAARTWISDSPATHYANGIAASFDFYDLSGASAYTTGTNVQYTPATGIEQIITQKYINFFMQGGWEAFYNHRRTGFPDFSVDGGGVLNSGMIPKRWMYPEAELQLNLDNVQEAISRQYPGGDDINEVMWLLKSE